jgi:hypothetical protein
MRAEHIGLILSGGSFMRASPQLHYGEKTMWPNAYPSTSTSYPFRTFHSVATPGRCRFDHTYSDASLQVVLIGVKPICTCGKCAATNDEDRKEELYGGM